MDQSSGERRSVSEHFQQLWSQALVAVTSVEEEAARLTSKLPGFSNWHPEEIRKSALEVAERLQLQRRQLERRLDEAVSHSLGVIRIPTREEVARLNARLDEIARRIEALSK